MYISVLLGHLLLQPVLTPGIALMPLLKAQHFEQLPSLHRAADMLTDANEREKAYSKYSIPASPGFSECPYVILPASRNSQNVV